MFPILHQFNGKCQRGLTFEQICRKAFLSVRAYSHINHQPGSNSTLCPSYGKIWANCLIYLCWESKACAEFSFIKTDDLLGWVMWLWWQIIQGGGWWELWWGWCWGRCWWWGWLWGPYEAVGEDDNEDVGEDDGEDVHLRSHHDLEAVDNTQRSAHDVNLFDDNWIDCDGYDSDDKNNDEERRITSHLYSPPSPTLTWFISKSKLLPLEIR